MAEATWERAVLLASARADWLAARRVPGGAEAGATGAGAPSGWTHHLGEGSCREGMGSSTHNASRRGDAPCAGVGGVAQRTRVSVGLITEMKPCGAERERVTAPGSRSDSSYAE